MADQSPGDPHVVAALKAFAPYVPGIAGAMLSMAFGERLTLRGKALSVGVGMAAAIFIAPAAHVLAGMFWPGELGELPQQIKNFISFLTGLLGMVFLSGFVEAVAKYSRHPLGLVRFQAGGLTIGGGLAADPGEGAQ